jgi:hypothetical protein
VSPNGWRRDFALIDRAHVTKRENWGLESGDRFSPHQPNLRYLLAYKAVAPRCRNQGDRSRVCRTPKLLGGTSAFAPAAIITMLLAALSSCLQPHGSAAGVDARGRLWIGTMDNELHRPNGSLYRVDGNGAETRMFGDVIVTNGIAFSPDNRTLYFTDTRRFEHGASTSIRTNARSATGGFSQTTRLLESGPTAHASMLMAGSGQHSSRVTGWCVVDLIAGSTR